MFAWTEIRQDSDRQNRAILPEVTTIMKNLPPLALPDPGDYDEVKMATPSDI